ncbi:hypothetical protein Taro_048091 [Colocasia esculenta]|uniref:Uncharacterized protein n=1 Tax=Colocasia esculenta TaxID=4460 RepID=A0A843WUU1_COLES|nr:hypothetical protein [Colocasia esculenta]
MWIMECSCKVWYRPCRRRPTPRLHSRLSWRLRQEGEMQKYLEEKKASQKRPAATFQRQDKRKAVYQAPQRPVTTSSAQVPSQRSPGVKKECPHCGKTHGGSNVEAATTRSRIVRDFSRESSAERQPQQR